MRRSGTRGYTGYRGRRPGGRRWLILALVLVILAATAFLVAQRYMVYGSGGAYRFELPWFRRGSSKTPGTRLRTRQELEIIIEEPTPAEAARTALHAWELDPGILSGGVSRALGALPDGVNALAVRLKTPAGELLYPSALSTAIESRAVVGGSIARSSIEDLLSAGYYTVARLSALHDSRFAAAHKADAAIQQLRYKGEVWYAPDSTFYLAPEKELTRQYLADLAAEVAALGFDELLFDDFAYPAVGRLDNIRTDGRGMTQQEALALLAGSLREALDGSGARLSLVMDEETVLAGGNAVTGQDLASLAGVFDRIYVPTAEERLGALQAALEPYDAELVPILPEPAAAGDYLISQ